jgi:ABC-type transporter Mla maintaining outer membrane lipid asymmetry ATPase subunit MlaF
MLGAGEVVVVLGASGAAEIALVHIFVGLAAPQSDKFLLHVEANSGHGLGRRAAAKWTAPISAAGGWRWSRSRLSAGAA